MSNFFAKFLVSAAAAASNLSPATSTATLPVPASDLTSKLISYLPLTIGARPF
jgi:hypothetical protein